MENRRNRFAYAQKNSPILLISSHNGRRHCVISMIYDKRGPFGDFENFLELSFKKSYLSAPNSEIRSHQPKSIINESE
jgi:hypothetical protein